MTRWAVLVAPLLLAVVPQALLERAPVICPVRRFLGARCPGCGMTRALVAALHGDLGAAWQHNRLVVVVGPLLAGLWVDELRRTLAGSSRLP